MHPQIHNKMAYDSDGPVAKQLVPLLTNELANTYGIPDDAGDVAEYINVMIGNQRAAADICAEVKDVVNIPIDEAFIGRVFAEIGRLETVLTQQQQQQTQPPPTSQFPEAPNFVSQGQQQTQEIPQIPQIPQIPTGPLAQNPVFAENQNQQQQQPQESQQQPFATDDSSAQGAQWGAGPTAFAPKARKNVNFAAKNTTDLRKGQVTKGRGGKNGVTKGTRDFVSKGAVGAARGAGPTKGLAGKSAASVEKALALSAHANSVDMAPFVPRAPKGRCPDHPHCRNRACVFSHPTKTCFAYPNCTNPPGTCDYLHPNEDGELMAELEKTKAAYEERKAQRLALQVQVTLCKYGILCLKELCPFGHPTPANQDAKVIVARWCKDNKNCTNPECQYAHSSPNYQRPAPAPAPPKPVAASKPAYNGGARPQASILEQCKFGTNCTNNSCPRRHATSLVPCRDGSNCTKLYCTYHHLINEECRFGDGCKNTICFFRHPDGRENAHFPQGNERRSERTFAEDDLMMEAAVQQ